MNTWQCRECSKNFPHDASVQYRVWFTGWPPQIHGIECFDPSLEGMTGVPISHISGPVPDELQDLLKSHPDFIIGPAWYCDECFAKVFPPVKKRTTTP